MFFLFFFLNLLCLSHVFGGINEAYHLAATEGEPSSYVEHCVSALSGDFVFVEEDLYVQGAQPIQLRRSYLSRKNGSATAGMYFSPHHFMYAIPACRLVHITEPSGTTLSYVISFEEGKHHKKKKKHQGPRRLNLISDLAEMGLTNCGQGDISGRRNLKNNYAVIEEEEGKIFKVFSGSGAERCYKLLPHQDKILIHPQWYNLQWEKLPNGNIIWYGYDRDNRLDAIRTTNADRSKTYASATVHYLGNVKDNADFDIKTSDGKTYSYRFHRTSKHKEDAFFLLEKISSTEKPEETLRYHAKEKERGPLLAARTFPAGRTIQADYYHLKNNSIANTNVFIDTPSDPRFSRVKTIAAPVGSDATLITTHRFLYHLGDIGKSGGHTHVYDVFNNRTTYCHSPELRLTEIQRYSGEDTFQNLEKLAWGQKNTQDTGNLLAKSFIRKDGSAELSRRFFYDSRGNVTEEHFYGNLSGDATTSLTLDSSQLPLNNGAECYKKRYFYTDDGRNLLVREEEDNGKTTLYSYLSSTTDHVASILILDKDKIKLRHFYEYNQDHILIREITDDGSRSNKNDLTDVQERRIKETSLVEESPFIGMPKALSEKYLDLASGQEILLKKTILAYSPQGQIIRQDIYDAAGTLRYSLHTKYDTMGRPIEETNAIGQTAFSSYDLLGNKTQYKDFSGNRTLNMSYDHSNRLILTEELAQDAPSRLTRHRYDYRHNKIATIDSYDLETKFTYDAFGNPLETHLPPTLDQEGHTFSPKITHTYDSAGRQISITDPSGETTQKQYTARNKPSLLIHSDGTKERFIYSFDGLLKKAIDQEDNYTLYTHDIFGRETNKTFYSPSGEPLSEEHSIYSTFHLLSKIDSEGTPTFYKYDSAGRKASEDCAGEKTEYTYDTLGRLSCIKTASGKLAHFAYDLLGRTTEERMEDEAGTLFSKTLYEYDTLGNKSAVTRSVQDAEAKEFFLYDSRGRLKKHIDPLGNATHVAYKENHLNSLGQKVLQKIQTNPLGLITIETHDIFGKVVQVEKQNAFGEKLSSEELFYDPSGRLCRQLSAVIPSGQHKTTLWEYAPKGKLLSLTEAAGSPDQKTTRYTYTAKGLRERLIKPDGVTLFHLYDPLSRLLSLTSSDSSIHYTYTYNRTHHILSSHDHILNTTIFRSYDKRGNLLAETLASGHLLTNTYDSSQRRTQLTLPDNSAIHYNYDPLFLKAVSRSDPSGNLLYTHHYSSYDLSGHLVQEELIDNLGPVHFQIDPLGRTKALSSSYAKQNILAYDPAGNIRHTSWSTPLFQEETTYDYDDLNQLSKESGRFPSTFSYDSHNNRLTKNNDTYQLNPLNQLLATLSATYTYDPNGNPLSKKTQDGTIHYTYDALDRLIEITKPNSAKLQFTYDSFHRRQTKTFFTYQNNTYEQKEHLTFLYDQQNEIGAFDSTNTLCQLRILGSTPQAEIGAAIALELNGETFAPIHDLSGNILALISLKTRALAEAHRYSAFGETPSTSLSPWRFSSKRTDEETGLVYYGRRYYDPSIGRWLTPDPAGLADGPNLYAFLLNNPLTHLDLYGLEAEPISRFQPALNLAKQTFSYIGKTLSDFFYHTIPFPYLRQAGMAIGNIISRQPKHKHIHSQGHTIPGTPILRDNVEILYINGQVTTLNEAKEQAQRISDVCGGQPVRSIYSSTDGALFDTGESFIGKFGIPTHVVDLATTEMRTSLTRIGPDGTLVIIPWSQGAIVTELAVQRLTPEQRSQIVVRSIGSAALFAGKGMRDVQHFASEKDIVPLTDMMRYLRARFSDNSNVTFLPSKESFFTAHSFKSTTYQDALTHIGKEIFRDYKKP